MMDKKQFLERNIPLTQSQLMLWMGQKLLPKGAMYNMAHAFEIHQQIDEVIFKKSFQDLIDNSDVFRIIFSEHKGIPSQSILKSLTFDLEIIDHTNLEIEATEKVLRERTSSLFNLDEPLFDSALYKLGQKRYIWFLNIHHLVTDATSSTILFEALSKIYKQHIKKGQESFLELPSYRDYIGFENKVSEDSNFDQSRNYWEQTVKNIKVKPALYGNKNKKGLSFSNRIKVNLGKYREEKLEVLANRPEFRCWTKDLTYFNIFLTALFAYVKRVSGEDNFAIGALSHNRTTHVFKRTPGMFVELFPIVAQFSENDSFQDLYKKVREETNDYLRNAQPGMATAQASASFNVVLNYIKSSFSDFNDKPIKSQWIHPGHCDPAHHLRVTVYDMDKTGAMELFFDVNESVFPKKIQEEISEHFLKVLDAFLEDSNVLVNKPSLINENDYLAELNGFEFNSEYGLCLEKIIDVINNNGDEVAIQFESDTYTFNDIDCISDKICTLLKGEGIRHRDRVVLHLKRSPEYIVALLAIIKLGAVFVPISSDQPKDRVEYIINNSECKLVITDKSLESSLSGIGVPFVNLEEEKVNIEALPRERQYMELSKNDIAYILYTSGSTGNPKGVLVSNEALSNYLFWAKDYYNTSKETIMPLFTSIGFDLTITSTLLPLVSGGRIIVYKENNIGTDTSLMRVLEDNLVNIIKLTPSHLAFMEDKDLSRSKIRTMIVGGEDFKVNLAKTIVQAFNKPVKIYNEYGPTEATVGCIVSEFSERHEYFTSVPIGLPIRNMHAYILDSNKNLVPNGVVGKLYLSGASLAKGYLNLDELTNAEFIDNPFVQGMKMYHTGDLARINENGEFEFLGRLDEQVKLRGFRIELSEIEHALQQNSSIMDAVAVVIQLNGLKQLVAFYRGAHEMPPSLLRSFLESKLPDYMIPVGFKYLETFPLTSNGKVDRKQLEEDNEFLFESNQEYQAPRNEIEELIADIWSKTLNIEKVGIYDNFLALGGHSLLAMRLTSQINEELEMEIPLFKVFECPTVALYAKHVENTIISLLGE